MRLKSMILMSLVFVNLAFATPALATETLMNSDGATYHGEVVEVTDSTVVIDADWPPLGRVTLQASELEPRSWWQVRSNRLGDDTEARLALAKWAESRGLLVQAVSELRKARRDAAATERADAEIARLGTKIAEDLVARGDAFLAEGRPAAAQRYFEIVATRYAKTDVAATARERLATVREALAQAARARKEAREASRALSAFRQQASAWDADVKNIRLHVEKADEHGAKVAGHARSVRDSRHLRERRTHLEAAWKKAEELGLPPEGVAPDDADRIRDAVKAKLLATYLRLGESELLRGSVARAEDWCTKACDLDPEGKENHALHGRIIDALLLSGAYGHAAR